jgi:DNA-binding winged helix-turn-helix (wHTH) protein
MTNEVLDEDRDQSQDGDRPVKISLRGSKLLEYLHLDELVRELVKRDTANPELVRACWAELQQYKVDL